MIDNPTITDTEVVEFMAKTVRHVSADSNETVEIEFIERNAAGQVVDRYITRVTYPPLATRMARAQDAEIAPIMPDPVDVSTP